MTEANNANCKLEGEKADFEIEDFCMCFVADDTAGEAAEDILETAPREDFLALILFQFEGASACDSYEASSSEKSDTCQLQDISVCQSRGLILWVDYLIAQFACGKKSSLDYVEAERARWAERSLPKWSLSGNKPSLKGRFFSNIRPSIPHSLFSPPISIRTASCSWMHSLENLQSFNHISFLSRISSPRTWELHLFCCRQPLFHRCPP